MAVDCINRIFQSTTNDFNVSSIKLKRTGHARFRRGPSLFSSNGDISEPSTSSQSEEKLQQKQQHAPSSVISTRSSSIVSSLAGGHRFEETVSSGKSLGIIAPAPTFSSRKPPLPSTNRKRCTVDRSVVSVHRSGSSCHCCKRRKSGFKKCEIRRVPIIGSKITSIPADDYSWKKYGEKKIDGSRYPKVYYKCSTGKGCPARKRVEFDFDESKMLVITYDGEHRHGLAPTPVPMNSTGVLVSQSL